MYSKKINQLATNLNPQETDLIPIGDAITGQLKTTTFNSISGITGDGVISGGIVTWTGTGLIFNISACTYILNGIRYSSPFSTKTLAAADPTNPRIDVFAVNTSSQVEVIQGTPASNPIEPEGDTATTLGLTNVTINAGATTPNNVSRDLIYDENVETWTKAQSVTGSFDYNNTAFAYTGSKSLLVTMIAGYAYFDFSKAVAMDISNYKSISFAIRLNTAWTSNTILAIKFYNGTSTVSNLFQITANNNVGFNRNLAGQWQLITIPFNNTNLKFTNNAFTLIRIQTTNAAVTYRLDTIQLNGGINNPIGGGTTPSNSFGFINGTTGTASSTTATDTLNVVGTGLATTSATGKTLTIAVPTPIPSQTGNSGKFLTTNGTAVSWGAAQAQLNGTGFVKASGTSITYDNTTYITGNQSITLSGDISGTGTTAITTAIGANKVTNAMLAQIATGTFHGRVTAATGDVETLTGTQATTLLNTFTSSLKGLAPASGGGTTNFLRADGTWAAAGGGNTIYTGDGTLTGDRTLTSGGFNLTFTGSNTATSAIARGLNLTHTLVASANSDSLVALDINPTFTNGAFTNVSNIGLRVNNSYFIVSGDYFPATILPPKGLIFEASGGTARISSRFASTSASLTISASALTIAPATTFSSNINVGGSDNNFFQFVKVKYTLDAGGIFGSYGRGLSAANDMVLYALASRNLFISAPTIRFTSTNEATEWGRFFSTTGNVQFQNGGTFTDIASARLAVNSTTQGFLPPRMTTTEKNAIASPVAGLVIYDTTLNKLCVYTTAWQTITSL